MSYPQTWLKLQNAVTNFIGWKHPDRKEILKCERHADDRYPELMDGDLIVWQDFTDLLFNTNIGFLTGKGVPDQNITVTTSEGHDLVISANSDGLFEYTFSPKLQVGTTINLIDRREHYRATIITPAIVWGDDFDMTIDTNRNILEGYAAPNIRLYIRSNVGHNTSVLVNADSSFSYIFDPKLKGGEQVTVTDNYNYIEEMNVAPAIIWSEFPTLTFNTNTQTVSGTGGNIIKITTSKGHNVSVTANTNGDFTATLPLPKLVEGDTITAIDDILYKESSTVAPAIVWGSFTNPKYVTNTGVLTASGVPNTQVKISVNGAFLSEFTIPSSGTLSFTFTNKLQAGDKIDLIDDQTSYLKSTITVADAIWSEFTSLSYNTNNGILSGKGGASSKTINVVTSKGQNITLTADASGNFTTELFPRLVENDTITVEDNQFFMRQTISAPAIVWGSLTGLTYNTNTGVLSGSGATPNINVRILTNTDISTTTITNASGAYTHTFTPKLAEGTIITVLDDTAYKRSTVNAPAIVYGTFTNLAFNTNTNTLTGSGAHTIVATTSKGETKTITATVDGNFTFKFTTQLVEGDTITLQDDVVYKKGMVTTPAIVWGTFTNLVFNTNTNTLTGGGGNTVKATTSKGETKTITADASGNFSQKFTTQLVEGDTIILQDDVVYKKGTVTAPAIVWGNLENITYNSQSSTVNGAGATTNTSLQLSTSNGINQNITSTASGLFSYTFNPRLEAGVTINITDNVSWKRTSIVTTEPTWGTFSNLKFDTETKTVSGGGASNNGEVVLLVNDLLITNIIVDGNGLFTYTFDEIAQDDIISLTDNTLYIKGTLTVPELPIV